MRMVDDLSNGFVAIQQQIQQPHLIPLVEQLGQQRGTDITRAADHQNIFDFPLLQPFRLLLFMHDIQPYP